MLEEKLVQLGASRAKIDERQKASLLASIQRDYGELPSEYVGMLMYFGGDIDFNEVVSYKPKERNPWSTAEGRNTLDRIYGLNSKYDSMALAEVAATYKNRMPNYWIPIAAAPGGNQICLCTQGDMSGVIYFWDHESEFESALGANAKNYTVEESLSRFIASLEVEPRSGVDLNDIEVDLKF